MLTESFELHPEAEPRVAPVGLNALMRNKLEMTLQMELRWHFGVNAISNTGLTELLQFMLMDADTSGTK